MGLDETKRYQKCICVSAKAKYNSYLFPLTILNIHLFSRTLQYYVAITKTVLRAD